MKTNFNSLCKKIILVILFTSIFVICFAESFSSNAPYQVCFTPEQNCTQVILDEIGKAKKQILVQMYTFTSPAIAEALVNAKRRGVEVKILLDKSQVDSKYSVVRFFKNNGVFVHINRVSGIAHNKLMMIDGLTTMGGSFNYTNNAQKNNLENVTIIKDAVFTRKYVDNWYRREITSVDGNNCLINKEKHHKKR